MQSISLASPHISLPDTPRAVALGLFDGVHLGHRRVIREAVGHPGLTATVFTFTEQAAALKPNASALCSPVRTAQLFEILGVDEWCEADFEAFRDLSPEAFVEDVLVRQLHAARVCCGFNFRFGKHGAGDVKLLRSLCDANGIELVVADELCDDEGTVCSARIRRLIENGDVQTASRLLGHPFMIDTPVVHGQALGRALGFPTANQLLFPRAVRPRFGVYMSTVVIDGRTYYGVSNLGLRPTVGADTPLCETWIDGFDGDLYDVAPQVILTRFLREERRFDSVEALKAQVWRDREEARRLRDEPDIKAVLFDFDDTLQNRPAAFMKYVRFFLDRYLPELDAAGRENAARQMIALNNSGYVDYADYFTRMPKAVGVAAPPPHEVLFKEYQRVFARFVQPFDDAASTLEALRAKDYRLGIVTNGPLVQQHRKLDFSGLRPLLDTVVVSAEEGVTKPDPEMFFRAAARLGLSPAQCLFVGDHPINDIDGALQSGMKAVFIDTRLPACNDPAVPVIHTPSDLLTML